MRLVITADLHLKRSIPLCRQLKETETEWLGIQKRSLVALVDHCVDHGAHLCICGDIFDIPRPAYIIVNMFLDVVIYAKSKGIKVYTSIGNHDVPQHNTTKVDDCGYGVIQRSTYNLNELGLAFDYGGSFSTTTEADIMFGHILVWPSEDSKPPNTPGITAQQLLDLCPNIKYFAVGDYHHKFIYGTDRKVIVPGCLLRQTSKFKNYIPTCVLLDTDTGIIQELALPDTEDIISDEHIIDRQEAFTRRSALLEKVKTSIDVTMDYKQQLITKLSTVELNPLAKSIIVTSIEKARSANELSRSNGT